MSVILTPTELKVLNNLSRVQNPSVNLGNKLLEIIGPLITPGTPANASAAYATLTLDGVVVHGETLTIYSREQIRADVYELLADAAQSKSSPLNIPVDVSAHTTKATGTLTMDTQPVSGNTVTIGEKTYIFVPVGTNTADGEVSIGVDLAAAQAALVAAINGTDEINEPHPLVRAGAFADDASIITALIGGTAGNAIATTETFTAATNVFAAVALATGADCTATNAVTALVAAITASDTQGVGAADSTGDSVLLTADVSGVSGNEILVETTMENGSFGELVTALSRGADGTVSSALGLMIDETNLYVCIAANTVTGANWRKITLSTL